MYTTPVPSEDTAMATAWSHDYIVGLSDSVYYSSAYAWLNKVEGNSVMAYAYSTDDRDVLTLSRGRGNVAVYLPTGTLAAIGAAISSGDLVIVPVD